MKKTTELQQPHIRFYKPGGKYEAFTTPLSHEKMEQLAGVKLITQYGPGIDVIYLGDQYKTGLVSFEFSRCNYYGPCFIGNYKNGVLYPIAAKWFTGIGDPFVANLLIWGAR